MSELKKWVIYQCSKCGAKIWGTPSALQGKCPVQTKKNDKARACDGLYYPIGFEKTETPKEIFDFLNSSNLVEQYLEEMNKFSRGEIFTKRAMLLLVHGGRLVENSEPTSFNSFVQSTSGTGKDHQAKWNVKNLLARGIVEHFTRITPKTCDYLHSKEKEPYYNGDGQVLYLEDISQSVLNGESLRVRASGINKTAIVRDFEVKEMETVGKPILLCTAANSYLDEDQRRRFVTYHLDESEEQTKNIAQFKARIAEQGTPEYNPIIVNASYCLSRIKVTVPFSSTIIQSFPTSILARTGVSRLLDFVKASCALHQYQREQNERQEYIATVEDYAFAYNIFMGLFGQTQTLEPLTTNHQTLLNYLQGKKEEVNASIIHDAVGKTCFTQIKGTVKALGSLVKKGLIHSREEGLTYYSYLEQPKFSLITPEELRERVSRVSRVSEVSEVSRVTNGLNNDTEAIPLTPITPTYPDYPLFEVREVLDES